MRPFFHARALLALPLWLAGCAGASTAAGSASIGTPDMAAAPRDPAPVEPSEADRARRQAQAAFRQRWSPEALASACEAWKRLARLEPDAAGPHLRLAQAQVFAGDALLARDHAPDQARQAYAAARLHAERAAALDGADEAAYWRALAMARAAGLIDFAEMVLVQDEVLNVMTRLANAGRSFDHGGPDRFLGVLYAQPLSYSGRDLERSRVHFARALAADPDHLPTRISHAASYAVAAQDRSAFENEIRTVLQADAAIDPARSADIALSQARAQALLEAAPDLFE